ncbi:uncharacterized protein Triagg1_5382 [Trichoderma aggressivum f. europaeum]|uniref:Core Histone H2A/H2B/H3 domain-containing protein n=1 Tax=Trichoderma aggressivum f. europaeum TaxID=173218 RepID=A0AAE1ICZ7_9HYPO|nr:hypothetical protein Triagg1_5382 [Trichoderma aggressivum f. europaeum]
MDRIKKAAPASTSVNSQGKVAMVEQEGDEDFRKRLAAKATRKTILRKIARRRSTFRRSPKRRWEPGKVEHRQVNKPQRITKLVIHKTPFIGLCRSIVSEIGCRLGFDSVAMDALQVACEAFLVDYFAVLNLTALHANRVKIIADDAAYLVPSIKMA